MLPLSVWRKRFRRYVPITEWMRTYTQQDLVADFIAGLTLGLTMIPQSIAYAALAGLAPQVCILAIVRLFLVLG